MPGGILVSVTASNSQFTALVEFTWGDASVARYARWPEDLVIEGDTFAALPALGIRQDKANNAGTDEDEFSITMPMRLPPADKLALPFKHAPVKVKIYESFLGETPTKRCLFSGKVGLVRVAPSSASPFVRMQIRSAKARLNVLTLGAPATSTCLNTFGQGKCLYDLEANKIGITVESVQTDGVPNRIEVSMVGSPTVTNDLFRRGYILIDGLSIGVRKALEDGTNPDPTHTLELREIVPPHWFEQTGFLYPGCDKSIEACRTRGQEARFLAPGFAMPEYNPAFSDDPQGG
jgi:hypothetical protein